MRRYPPPAALQITWQSVIEQIGWKIHAVDQVQLRQLLLHAAEAAPPWNATQFRAPRAAEAAAAQGAFWEMHDVLLDHQGELTPEDLEAYAERLDLDLDRFRDDLRRQTHAPRVEEDVDSADISGVTGTPTFFINERRHDGAYDIETLSAAVRAARARSAIAQ